MCLTRLKSGQQVELFLKLNVAFRFKSKSNSLYTKYLVRFKSKYETLFKQKFWVTVHHFRILLKEVIDSQIYLAK